MSNEYLERVAGDRIDAAFTSANGIRVPSIGLGTWRVEGSDARRMVDDALDVGYRHIDTAMAYENETEVGEAIEASAADREDVFLTTKVKGYDEYARYGGFRDAFEACLDRLGTDYVDLLLLHWWNPTVPVEETIEAMNDLQADGMVREIGVSNFSVDQLGRARRASETPILTNQIEFHPYRDRSEMLEYCRRHDVILTAYSPLAEGRVIGDERLAEIGARYDKSAAQVALRWLVQQENVVAIPKASSRAHQVQNLDVFDFELTAEEMSRIDELRGPLSYRLTAEGGPIDRLRRQAGTVRNSVLDLLSA